MKKTYQERGRFIFEKTFDRNTAPIVVLLIGGVVIGMLLGSGLWSASWLLVLAGFVIGRATGVIDYA